MMFLDTTGKLFEENTSSHYIPYHQGSKPHGCCVAEVKVLARIIELRVKFCRSVEVMGSSRGRDNVRIAAQRIGFRQPAGFQDGGLMLNRGFLCQTLINIHLDAARILWWLILIPTLYLLELDDARAAGNAVDGKALDSAFARFWV